MNAILSAYPFVMFAADQGSFFSLRPRPLSVIGLTSVSLSFSANAGGCPGVCLAVSARDRRKDVGTPQPTRECVSRWPHLLARLPVVVQGKTEAQE